MPLSDLYTFRFRQHSKGTWELVAYRSQGTQAALQIYKRTSTADAGKSVEDFEFQHRIDGQWLKDNAAHDLFRKGVEVLNANPPQRKQIVATPLVKALRDLSQVATLLAREPGQLSQQSIKDTLGRAWSEVTRNFPTK